MEQLYYRYIEGTTMDTSEPRPDTTGGGDGAPASGRPPLSRRNLFGLVGVTAVAGGLAACSTSPAGDTAATPSAPSAQAASGAHAAAPEAPQGDHVRVLGVNGGPVLSTQHSQPALALVVGQRVYLIDCGGNTAQRMVDAGLGFTGLSNVFLSHLHADHTAGLSTVAILGWTYPAPLGPLAVWGPPQTEAMIAGMQQSLADPTRLFASGGGFPPRQPVTARPVSLPPTGIVEVMRDDHVTVTATRVYHGPEVADAYAYRFDIAGSGRSVVFSGDTAGPNEALIALARGADVLFHEVQMTSAIDQILQRSPAADRVALRTHLLNSHTDVAVVPEVAQRAGVRHLVLCHYTPAFVPIADFRSAAEKAAQKVGFTGRLTAPTELDTITL